MIAANINEKVMNLFKTTKAKNPKITEGSPLNKSVNTLIIFFIFLEQNSLTKKVVPIATGTAINKLNSVTVSVPSKNGSIP